MPAELVPAEKARLVELELVVERGMQTFFEVGTALLEIRAKRLYRQTHSTFEAYCRERWGFSRSHGYRLIRAAELAVVSPVGDIENERQARAILEPGRPDPLRSLLALTFELEPDAALPHSVEAIYRHLERQPPTLDEALEAAGTHEEKIEITHRRWLEVPEFAWEITLGSLLDAAFEETGTEREDVAATLELLAKAIKGRWEELSDAQGEEVEIDAS